MLIFEKSLLLIDRSHFVHINQELEDRITLDCFRFYADFYLTYIFV